MSHVAADDVRAALTAHLDPPQWVHLSEVLPADATFPDYEALARALPPEELGISPGLHAAVLGPLFGEFE
ncbi:MAG: hypothetical protein RIB67_09510 [Miltoncostaeaceae bacterium]